MSTAIKASPAPPSPPLSGIRYCECCHAIYRQDFKRCPFDGASLVVGPTDPWVGSMVGSHYVVDALVGEGAMGRVYRAHHKDIPDRHYAIKILIGDLAATEQMRTRFQLEAENASKLAHPNVVGVIDYGVTARGVNYIVMDLVEGPSLGAIVQQGPMNFERVIKLARQLCEGLDHAHSRGMIHRDFKPDNILVVGDGALEVARIADFGLALSLDTEVRLTTTGIVCTPAYAAPEQLRGQPIDQRVDLYALGTTIYEMLSGGQLPFNGDLDTSVRSKLMNDAPSVLLVAPNVPPSLVSIIGRLLSSDPTRRPRSAKAVIRALDGALAAPRSLMRTDQTLSMRKQTAGSLVVDPHDSSKLPNKAASKSPSEAGQPALRATSARKISTRVDLKPRRPFRRAMIQLFAAGITFGGALAWFGLRDPDDVKAAITDAAKLPRAQVVESHTPSAEAPPMIATEPVTSSRVTEPTLAQLSAPNVAQASEPVAAPKPVAYTIARKKKPQQHRPQRAKPDLLAAFDASSELDSKSISLRYGAIFRALKRLDTALGRENTDDLWSAFRSVQIAEAIASAEARVEAADTLAMIHEAIVDRSAP